MFYNQLEAAYVWNNVGDNALYNFEVIDVFPK